MSLQKQKVPYAFLMNICKHFYAFWNYSKNYYTIAFKHVLLTCKVLLSYCTVKCFIISWAVLVILEEKCRWIPFHTHERMKKIVK